MAPPPLSREFVRHTWHYDAGVGELIWRHDEAASPTRNGHFADQRAGWSVPGRRYMLVNVGGQRYRASRLAWMWMTGEWQHMIGHLNGDISDIRWINLFADDPESRRRRAFEDKYIPEPNSGCWLWLGALDKNGYGKFSGSWWAHRAAYDLFVGPIPSDLEIDHLCRNRGCVNPGHFEVVTSKVNTQRGEAGQIEGARHRAITHCPAGHAYDEVNTYRTKSGSRSCRACHRARAEQDRIEKGDRSTMNLFYA